MIGDQYGSRQGTKLTEASPHLRLLLDRVHLLGIEPTREVGTSLMKSPDHRGQALGPTKFPEPDLLVPTESPSSAWVPGSFLLQL